MGMRPSPLAKFGLEVTASDRWRRSRTQPHACTPRSPAPEQTQSLRAGQTVPGPSGNDRIPDVPAALGEAGTAPRRGMSLGGVSGGAPGTGRGRQGTGSQRDSVQVPAGAWDPGNQLANVSPWGASGAASGALRPGGVSREHRRGETRGAGWCVRMTGPGGHGRGTVGSRCLAGWASKMTCRQASAPTGVVRRLSSPSAAASWTLDPRVPEPGIQPPFWLRGRVVTSTALTRWAQSLVRLSQRLVIPGLRLNSTVSCTCLPPKSYHLSHRVFVAMSFLAISAHYGGFSLSYLLLSSPYSPLGRARQPTQPGQAQPPALAGGH